MYKYDDFLYLRALDATAGSRNANTHVDNCITQPDGTYPEINHFRRGSRRVEVEECPSGHAASAHDAFSW